jgi:hypothetical protein
MRTPIIKTPHLTILANGKPEPKRISKTEVILIGDFLVTQFGMTFERHSIMKEKCFEVNGVSCKPYWQYHI